MNKKALILDLDNTIYPVNAYGEKLFQRLFTIIKESSEYEGDFEAVRTEILRRPFQYVAKEFSFSEKLSADCLQLLSNATYDEAMQAFEDYEGIRNFSCKKFLVTTGFPSLQHSKIKQLGIANDFEKIYVVDPSTSAMTKKDVFAEILTTYGYNPGEVLVIGDDLHSEIKAAKELGIDTVLFDHRGVHAGLENQQVIGNYKDLYLFIAG